MLDVVAGPFKDEIFYALLGGKVFVCMCVCHVWLILSTDLLVGSCRAMRTEENYMKAAVIYIFKGWLFQQGNLASTEPALYTVARRLIS